MQVSYPAVLEHQDDGSVLISFPDVPEALTEGANEAEALAEAADCLIAALGGYIEQRRELPAPSRIRKQHRRIDFSPLVAAKLALFRAMQETGTTRVSVAKQLGVTETIVRRLLDLDHRSHIGELEKALAVFEKRLTVAVTEWPKLTVIEGGQATPAPRPAKRRRVAKRVVRKKTARTKSTGRLKGPAQSAIQKKPAQKKDRATPAAHRS